MKGQFFKKLSNIKPHSLEKKGREQKPKHICFSYVIGFSFAAHRLCFALYSEVGNRAFIYDFKKYDSDYSKLD